MEQGAPGKRPWLVLGAAVLAGFLGAGTFASSAGTAVLLVVSVFVATFLGTLLHGIFTEPAPDQREPAGLKSSEPIPLDRA